MVTHVEATMRRRVPRRSPATVRLIPYPSWPTGRSDQARAEGSLALAPGHAPPTGPPGPSRVPPRPVPPGARLRAIPDRPAQDEPDPVGVAETITRLIVEVLAGVRPAHQLSRRATPSVCAELGLTAPRPAPPGPRPAGRRQWPPTRPRVLSWRVQEPVPGAAEVSAVVLIAGRVHAVALRLEPVRGRWLCSAIETTIHPCWPPQT
jgi:Family of unknown function (DUF6459)